MKHSADQWDVEAHEVGTFSFYPESGMVLHHSLRSEFSTLKPGRFLFEHQPRDI